MTADPTEPAARWPAPSTRPASGAWTPGQVRIVVAAAVATLVVVGVVWWDEIAAELGIGPVISGSELELIIEDGYRGRGFEVDATCPRSTPQRAGQIVDCSLVGLTIGDMTFGRVRVTIEDAEGHLTYQPYQ